MEDVRAELEAVMAVYGEDCRILQEFPPHLDVSIRPRTADDLAQQFVEAVIGLRAGIQYPSESPDVIIVDSKGLDAERREKLIAMVRCKAMDLASYPMLISLCEDAVDILTDMNHPEGNCPLCLDPLFLLDSSGKLMSFMKLMSCFHCFHCQCILRWWHWVREEAEKNVNNQSQRVRPSFLENQRGSEELQNLNKAKCPICRKVFDSRDLKHIVDLNESRTPEPVEERDFCSWELLQSDAEIQRREQFEALTIVQREKGGLIEPKKDLVVAPGMFLPQQPSISGSVEEGPAAPPGLDTSAKEVIRKPIWRRRVEQRNGGAQSSRRKCVKKERDFDF